MLKTLVNINFNCITTSKFFNISDKINKSIIYFVAKQSNRFKILFFFLLVTILLSCLPKNKNKLSKFICFYFFSNFQLINSLVLLYLPVLGYILEVESNFKNSHSFFVLSDFPFMFEFDIICENYSLFLDYFLDFKFIFFFKFKTNYSLLNETLIRCLYKLPVRFKN